MEDNFASELISHLSSTETNPLSVPEICDFLNDYDVENVTKNLEEMVARGMLMKTPKKQKYTVPEKLGCKAGIVLMNQKGFAFVRPSLDERDIFIQK